MGPTRRRNSRWPRTACCYGTTCAGGGVTNGSVFRLDTSGENYTVLHRFSGSGDGKTPYAGLIQGLDGALYGTTIGGGTSTNGTLFKLNTDGSGYSVLYSFIASTNGQNPYAELLQTTNGLLYGTTYAGGTNGRGAVFRFSLSVSNFTVVYHFKSSGNDGQNPRAALILGKDGVLYGTTYQGGSVNAGTVFKVATNGSGYSLIRSLSGHGRHPSLCGLDPGARQRTLRHYLPEWDERWWDGV